MVSSLTLRFGGGDQGGRGERKEGRKEEEEEEEEEDVMMRPKGGRAENCFNDFCLVGSEVTPSVRDV